MAFWRTQESIGNPYILASPTDTASGLRLQRLFREYAKIDGAARYVADSGLCPVCRVEQTGHGITCGRARCVEKWLFPYLEYQRVAELEDGVE